MKLISIEEQKQIQLNILSKIIEFCEQNNINYFLAYGTLLGAIRHKGYIPWDDDIDIWMPEPDYDKFLTSFSSDNYKIIHIGSSCKPGPFFVKVHDERTRFQEPYSIKNNYGIFVDVFPLHAYGGYAQWLYGSFLLRLIRIKQSIWYNPKPFYKNVANTIGKFFLSIIPPKYIWELIEKNTRIHKYETSYFIHTFKGDTMPYLKEWFSNFVMVPFEHLQCRVPKDYDSVLKNQYGDYMKLPPAEERVPKHHAQVWWKE